MVAKIDLYGGETKAHFRFASGSPLKNFFLLNQIFKELTPVGGKLWMFPQVKMMMWVKMGRCNQDLSRIHSDQGCSVRSLLVAANLILIASPGGERKCRKVEPSPTPRSSDMPHCEGDHPLIRLQGNQFLTLRDVAHAHSMLLQQCPSQIRLHILSKQLEIWVGWWSQMALGTHSVLKLRCVIPIDPILVHGCFETSQVHAIREWLTTRDELAGDYITVVLQNGHWYPLLHGMQERCSLCDNLGCSTCKAFWSRRVLSILCSITGGQVGANCSTFTVVLWRWSVWCSEHCIPWSQDPWNTVARS